MKPQLFFKLSEEVSKDFSSLMASAIMQKTLESLKDASDTGTFKFVISTDDEDRQGEKVNQAGLDFGQYMKNPVVLWGHKYDQPPVGVTTRIYKESGKTLAEGKWASTPFAQELRKLYDEGIINACSIGYIPKELDEDGNTQKGEVLEYSIVSIPANPYALSQRMVQEKKIDLALLANKGMDFKFESEIKHTKPAVKSDAQAGDSCQLDDGTAGTMSDDGNGGLQCVPIENAGIVEKPKAADGANDSDNSDSAEDNLHQMLGGEKEKHKSYSMDAVEEFKTFAKGSSEDGDGKKAAAGKMTDKVDGEHDRHDKAVTKGIEEFTKSIEEFHSGTKAAKPKPEDSDGVPAPVTKALEEFKSAATDEMDDHREKCMKSVQEYSKKAMKEDSADKIDSLHEKCTKSINQAHEAHTKAMDGHIEKCMKSIEEFGDGEKAAKAEKNKASVADELAESQEKQAKFQKVNKVWDIFDAFICAYLDDGTAVGDFEKLLDEAISLMKGGEKQMSDLLKKFFAEGAYKKFSKTNLDTIKKALAEHEKAMAAHDNAQDEMSDVHKSHKAVHAALKALVSGAGEAGDEGKEDDQKSAELPKPKVDKTSIVEVKEDKELESFLLDRDLLKSFSKAFNGALAKHNEMHGKKRPEA